MEEAEHHLMVARFGLKIFLWLILVSMGSEEGETELGAIAGREKRRKEGSARGSERVP